MATYTQQQVGDILANAPVSPTNFADIADGITCRCNPNINTTAGNTLVNYTATIALATAPATNLIDNVKIKDVNGADNTITLSRQYLVSTLVSAGIIAELQAEMADIFGRYLVSAGNVTVSKVGLNIVITVTARKPVIPLFVLVSGVAVNFV